jgi:hypothetical protein
MCRNVLAKITSDKTAYTFLSILWLDCYKHLDYATETDYKNDIFLKQMLTDQHYQCHFIFL